MLREVHSVKKLRSELGYLSTTRLVFDVVCGADLGPDVLQVRHGRWGTQRSRWAALQGAWRFGCGTHHSDLFHFVGLSRRLGRERLARGRFGGTRAALSTLFILSNRKGNRSDILITSKVWKENTKETMMNHKTN